MTSDGPHSVRDSAARDLAQHLGLPAETAEFSEQQRTEFAAWIEDGNRAWQAANERRTPSAA